VAGCPMQEARLNPSPNCLTNLVK